MFHGRSFIAFYDLTPEARILWVSDSITDCIGYSPEEVTGQLAYDLVVTDELPVLQVTHQENVMNDVVANQFQSRLRHKDGHSVPVVATIGICYDFIVGCTWVLEPDNTT
ncbi:hypothetical protein BGZ51_000415, partial [Haplosporangium sp. Z 767]